jgi:hypothetical protein
LHFTDVENSRCPTDVECFWTGQARITVDAEPDQNAPASLEFNTNPAPGQGTLTNDVGGYAIELRSLDPYPKTPDDSPALTDYSATLVMRKIA